MNRILFVVLLLIFSVFLFSCSQWATPYRMYKIDSTTSLSDNAELFTLTEHIISPDDELMLHVFANNAEILINPEFQNTNATTQQSIHFRVLKDGTIFLPAIGMISLGGKTITQAENILREEYKKFINEPYVSLKVTNKKVSVYKGGKNSAANLVKCNDNNPTLIETLTEAGGIMDGKSNMIYLIRGKQQNVKIYRIDMSVASNANMGNIVMQSGDVIYIVPQKYLSKRLIEDITPLFSFITTLLLIINLF